MRRKALWTFIIPVIVKSKTGVTPKVVPFRSLFATILSWHAGDGRFRLNEPESRPGIDCGGF